MRDSTGFKITRRSIDALRPSDRSKRGMWYADRDLSGFYAIAYASGETAFAARYRVNGQRRTVRLGRYPAVTPEDARKEALAVLGGAARGENEATKRRAARQEAEVKARRVSFGAWRKTYIEDGARRLKAPKEPARYLAFAGAAWDSRPLAEITTRDVETLRNRIAEKGKTQANRWLATIAASFSHAVRLGYIEVNPAKRVPFLPENPPRRRTLTEDEEARLRKAVKAQPDPFVRAAFTLLFDTGA